MPDKNEYTSYVFLFQRCASKQSFISNHDQLSKKSDAGNMLWMIEIYMSAIQENAKMGFEKIVIFL